ncbi:hypothetical protein PAI11_38030 [Patulibacter medicamentivorans]|uniref:Uncharacterized protein n=1 Tax=Patulibacter medicamentivorans TaxID=1097667 RepID=H0EAC9_9ACTN|nr:hypothetical protein [Patulibacter medicamentivorans]EHN09383.1 hypothetical protein PAI11_38030 [Patulibacter medicamentivorans]
MRKLLRLPLAALVVAGGALLPSTAPAAPTPEQRLNLLPPSGWLETVIDDVLHSEPLGRLLQDSRSAKAVPLGRLLQDALCPPVTEVDELVDGVPGLSDLTGLLTTGACNLDVLDYAFHTEFRRPNGQIVKRDVPATLEFPTPLNVDDDPAPEFLASLQVFSLDKATLKIERVPGRQEHLPASVEAVIADPSDGSLPRKRVAVGFDGMPSDAPTAWQTVIRLTDVFGDAEPTRFGATVTQTGATGPVALLAEVFDGVDGKGVRTNRMATRLEQEKPPQRTTADFAFAADDAIEANLRTTERTRTTVSARLQDDALDEEDRVVATIEDLPRSIDLRFQPLGEDDQRIDYQASEPIDRISADITARKGAPTYDTVVDAGLVHLRRAPIGATARIKTLDRRIEKLAIDTRGGPVGEVEAAFAVNGQPIVDPAPGAYVKSVDGEGSGPTQFRSSALRLFDVEQVRIEGTAPGSASRSILLDATMRSGPVRASFKRPDLEAEALVRNLPHRARLAIDPTAPRIVFDGHGQGIDEIAVQATSPEPLLERATHFEASVKGIPATMDLEVAEDEDGTIEFSSDAPVGEIDLRASDGHGESLPAGEQGVILRDQDDRWLLAARVFGLRQVRITPDPLDLLVRAGAGRPFTAKATLAQETGPDQRIDARIDALPRRVALRLVDDAASGTQVTYDADAPVARVSLRGSDLDVVDRADQLRLEIEDAPRHLEAKLPETGPVIEATASEPVGRLLIQAAGGALRELPANHDGILYHDTPSEYALTAGVSHLRSARIETRKTELEDVTDVQVDLPDSPRVFAIDMRTFDEIEGVEEFVRGYVDRPQARTEIRMRAPADGVPDEDERATAIRYRAAAPISELHLETDRGKKLGLLHATVANVPKQLDVCFHAGSKCRRNGSPNFASEASLEITDNGSSQQPMTVDALVCLEPGNERDCRSSDHRKKFLRLRDVQLGDLAFDVMVAPGGIPRAYIDTANRPVIGSIDYRDDLDFPGSWSGASATFGGPDGLRARHRSFIGPVGSGEIACSPGTSMRLVGLPDLPLTPFLCGF